jgi:hypothetical protein
MSQNLQNTALTQVELVLHHVFRAVTLILQIFTSTILKKVLFYNLFKENKFVSFKIISANKRNGIILMIQLTWCPF